MYDGAEFFAGKAMVAAALQERGFNIPALDVLYWDEWRQRKLELGRELPINNPMDCTQPSGFALLGHRTIETCEELTFGINAR